VKKTTNFEAEILIYLEQMAIRRENCNCAIVFGSHLKLRNSLTSTERIQSEFVKTFASHENMQLTLLVTGVYLDYLGQLCKGTLEGITKASKIKNTLLTFVP